MKLSNDAILVIHDVGGLPPESVDGGRIDAERFGFGPSPESLQKVGKVIEGIGLDLEEALDRIAPDTATVEFGSR